MNLKFISFNSNIGHFLHEELQYLLDIILTSTNNNITVYIPKYVLEDNIYRWHYNILKILENKNNKIKLIYTLEKDDIINIYPQHQMIKNIEHIKYITSIVFDYYNIQYTIKNPLYKVLYTRIKDTNRRHILNYEVLNSNFDLIIHSLDMSFEDQVKLFSKMTHFVSVESGAHFVNIMFMQKNAKVMNILTRTDFSKIDNRIENYDSWQKRFGTSILVSEFNINTKANIRVDCGDGPCCGDHDFHDHIFVDNELKNNILEFLN